MLKMELKSSVMLGLVVLFMFPVLVCADGTLTFRDGIDGYAGTEDTYLESGVPDWGFGDIDETKVINRAGNDDVNLIIRFNDLASLAGTTVTEAWISLYVSAGYGGDGTGNFTLEALQIADNNAGWTEGVYVAGPSPGGDPTWDSIAHPAAWNGGVGAEGGATILPTVSGSQTVNGGWPNNTQINFLIIMKFL